MQTQVALALLGLELILGGRPSIARLCALSFGKRQQLTHDGPYIATCFRRSLWRGCHGAAHGCLEGGAEGGVAGTLPDLDAFIDYGDAVRNMTYHRAESHGLFYLTLLAPLLAWGVSKIQGEAALFKRWCAAMWLALFTHPLLDTFTIYGTQLLQPFSEYPFGIGSMFIIDPLYTLPLLFGVIAALSMKQLARLRWNAAALGLSCAYLAWSVTAQAYVERIVRAQVGEYAQFFATPTPLNTIAWRVVVKRGDSYSEGFYSFFDQGQKIDFDDFANQPN